MMHNLTKSILNYYSTYNETKFRFDTKIAFAWTDDDLTLDIPFFPDVSDKLISTILTGNKINLEVNPKEYSIKLDKDLFIKSLLDGYTKLLTEAHIPSTEELETYRSSLYEFNRNLRDVVKKILFKMQKDKIDELQSLYQTTLKSRTSFNPNIIDQAIFDKLAIEIQHNTDFDGFKNKAIEIIQHTRYELTLFDLFSLLREFDAKIRVDKLYLFFHQISNNSGNYPLYFVEIILQNQTDNIRLTQNGDILYLNTPAININRMENVLTLPRAEHIQNSTTVIKELNGYLNNVYHGPDDFLLQKKFDKLVLDDYPSIVSRIGFQIVKKDSNNLLDYSELLALSDSVVGKKFSALIDDYINKNVIPTKEDIEHIYREQYSPRDVKNIVDENPLPLNKSQKKILLAAQHDKNRIIVVEGPPGTGKSHTIAALIYMASNTGRSVLVTSHKKQALDVIEDNLTQKFRHLHRRGKPAILRLDKSKEDTPNEPNKTLSNNAFNSASNRISNIDIEAVNKQLEGTFSHLTEQNKAYWQPLASDIDISQVLDNYKSIMAKLNLSELDEIGTDLTIEDKAACSVLIKRVQSINFALSYAKLRECYTNKDKFPEFKRAIDTLFRINDVSMSAIKTIEPIPETESFSKLNEQIAQCVSGNFKLFKDDLKLANISWDFEYRPQADEIEDIFNALNSIDEHTGMLNGILKSKKSKELRDKQVKCLQNNYPDFYANIYNQKSLKDCISYLNSIKSKLAELQNSSFYTAQYMLHGYRAVSAQEIKEWISNAKKIDYAPIIAQISEIKEKNRDALTLNDIMEGIKSIIDLSSQVSACKLVEEAAALLNTDAADMVALNQRLKLVKAVIDATEPEIWNILDAVSQKYSAWFESLAINLDDLSQLSLISEDRFSDLFSLIYYRSFLVASSGLEKPSPRDIEHYYELVYKKFEYYNDKKYSELQNSIGDVSRMQNSFLTGKRLSGNETEVLKNHVMCIIAQPSMVTDYFPMQEDIFDYLIIDEASQVSIADSLSLILRAKQTIIFGDELQYGAVSAVNVAEYYASAYFKDIIRSYGKDVNIHISEQDTDKLSKDVSKSFNENDDDEEIPEVFVPSAGKIEWLKTFSIRTSTLAFCKAMANYSSALDVHFRSFQEIISYSSEFFYSVNNIDLIVNRIRTKPIQQVLKFIKVDTTGQSAQNVNLDEIEVILAELKNLYESNYKGTIGVICSFRDQQIRMDKDFRKETFITHLKDENQLKIWFVGDVQGEERDTIFYSFVQDDKYKTADLRTIYPVPGGTADNIRKLKMQRLNVGFSRAKDTMVFVHSMSLDKYNDTVLGKALQFYKEQLDTTHDNFIEDMIVFGSPAEEEVYKLLTQTEYYQQHKNDIKLIAQFEIGKYLEQEYKRYIPKYRTDFLLTLNRDGKDKSLILEYDGFEYHFDQTTPHSTQYREYDLQRQLELESYGYKFLRLNKFNLIPTDKDQTKISVLNKYLKAALED